MTDHDPTPAARSLTSCAFRQGLDKITCVHKDIRDRRRNSTAP